MKKQNRLIEIDVLKGLAIILVVLGHSGVPITRFLYLFHVAVFIISSGFFYRDTTSDSIGNLQCFILRKIKQLWLPYFIWNTIFVLLNNIFIKINIYTDNAEVLQFIPNSKTVVHSYLSFHEIVVSILKGAAFKGDAQIGGAMWFLVILLFLSVAYGALDYLIKKTFNIKSIYLQGVLSTTFLLLGYIMSLKGIGLFGLAKVLSLYCLFYFGVFLGRHKTVYNNQESILWFATMVFSFLLLLLLYRFGTVSLVNNSYINPLFLITSSLAGWFFLFGLSRIICSLNINAIFEYVGENTLSILILHFLAFKPVAWVVAEFYNLPTFCVAAFPNLYGNKGIWWLGYTIVGVTAPLFCNYIYGLCFKQILSLGYRHRE